MSVINRLDAPTRRADMRKPVGFHHWVGVALMACLMSNVNPALAAYKSGYGYGTSAAAQVVLTDKMPEEISVATDEVIPTIAVTIPAEAGTRVVKRKGAKGSVMIGESAVDSNTDAEALYVSSAKTLKSGYIYSYTWNPCTEDSPFLLQGGFNIDPNVSVAASTRKDYSTWRWTIVNTSGTDRNVTLYVVCTDPPSSYTNISSTQIYLWDGEPVSSIPSGRSGGTHLACTSNSLVSYGFFVKTTDGGTPLSGHSNLTMVDEEFYDDGDVSEHHFGHYNSYSKPVNLTSTATCINNLDDWWGYVEVVNTYQTVTYSMVPNTIYSYGRTCASDKDTLGGGITFYSPTGDGEEYDQQYASKFKILGDYFQLSGIYAYWYNRVQNNSSATLTLGTSLACGSDEDL